MHTRQTSSPTLYPSAYFYPALAVVMLVYWLSFIPDWLTFVHGWKVELFASAFLGITLIFAYRNSEKIDLGSIFSRDEIRFILLPMAAFIVWSAASAGWASSWRSAVHHTLVWCVYLTFYCIVRHSLQGRGHYKKYLYVFAGALLLCSLPAVAGYSSSLVFGGGTTLGTRFSRFAEQVVTLLPLLFVAVVRLKSKKFAVGSAIIAGLWLLVYCSMSRAGILLFAVATLLTGSLIFTLARFQAYRLRLAIVFGALLISPIILQGFSYIPVERDAPFASRFSDRAALENSNHFRKLMASLSVAMISENPIIGIGADNFGFAVHEYRETYARANPSDLHLAQAENDLPERAHNEYLQIAAELGIVGAAIFAWFLLGIGVMAVRAVKGIKKLPVHAPAAIIGLGMFLAAALVTSYSFRLMQNGLVFFFVLAVAAKLLLTRQETADANSQESFLSARMKPLLAAGIIACLLLFVYSSIRVSSVIVTERANSTTDLEEAENLYKIAASLDTENPFVRYHHGKRLLREQRFAEAVPHLKDAISKGHAISESFSYLATAQTLAGDNLEAEKTIERALTIYPRSVFVLVRHAILQRENGNPNDAAATLQRAHQLDLNAARTWELMITQGFRVASSKQAVDEFDLMPVMDLQPLSGVYAVLTERLIKFPEEQRFSLFRAVNAKPAENEPGFETLKQGPTGP